MKQFSLTDLSNKSGEIVEAAYRGPVSITKRGKRKFVILTAEDYDRLAAIADPRRVYTVDTMPDGLRDMLIAGLDEIIRTSRDEG
jgi:prevent-host-death family protein